MKEIPTRVSAEKPQGAPFYVTWCPFAYGERIDITVLDLAEDKVLDWPMVYILANDESAYVGQTTSIANRVDQHSANIEKKDFERVNVIFNEEFNASVVTDYEHRIIDYMHGDGRYRLTNKNKGMTDTNYFSKAAYAEMFKDLWEELRHLELADHTIAEIEESEVFKYSPYKGLTPDQRIALDKIIDAISSGFADAGPIVVEGMPGTGKTVLATYLLKMLKDDPEYRGLNVKLLEPVSQLRATLKQSVACVEGLSADDVIGPDDLAKPEHGFIAGRKRNVDILLVDEAHRLKRRKCISNYGQYDKTARQLGLDVSSTQLEWILDQAGLAVFFYDPLQTVGPSCVGPEAFRKHLGDSLRKPIVLDTQMRVKGGPSYLDYVFRIVNDKDPEPESFAGYEFVLHDDFRDFHECFERTLRDHSLTRLIAGYAWEWVTGGRKREILTGPDAYDIDIDGIRLRWNSGYVNWVGRGSNDPSISHEVGCIHSIQGYDLSQAFVIIGNDLKYDEDEGRIVVDRSNYYDRNGKNTTTDEELDQFIRNIYYVLLTRGVYGTHVYICDSALRKHFRKYFDQDV